MKKYDIFSLQTITLLSAVLCIEFTARNKIKQNYLHETAEIIKLINEVKQLTDVICDRWTVWILSLQMLFIDLTDTYEETKFILVYFL